MLNTDNKEILEQYKSYLETDNKVANGTNQISSLGFSKDINTEDEKTRRLKYFFGIDNEIKYEMYHSAPPGLFQYFDEEKYCDKLEDSLKYMFQELKRSIQDFFGPYSTLYLKAQQIEVETIHKFYQCGYSKKKLREFYNNYISYMDPNFVDLVKKSCVGYTIDERNLDPIGSIKTINELLHYLHYYVMNSDNILQSLPVIDEKKVDNNYYIRLRGNDNEFFHSIFSNFPNEIDIGTTDMIVLDENKLLMMIRDRGHATTIEITIEGTKAKVDYFIPKLCNVDMINALPGVNKVNPNSSGATGSFVTEKDALSRSLYIFISMIPMDKDMPNVKRAR